MKQKIKGMLTGAIICNIIMVSFNMILFLYSTLTVGSELSFWLFEIAFLIPLSIGTIYGGIYTNHITKTEGITSVIKEGFITGLIGGILASFLFWMPFLIISFLIFGAIYLSLPSKYLWFYLFFPAIMYTPLFMSFISIGELIHYKLSSSQIIIAFIVTGLVGIVLSFGFHLFFALITAFLVGILLAVMMAGVYKKSDKVEETEHTGIGIASLAFGVIGLIWPLILIFLGTFTSALSVLTGTIVIVLFAFITLLLGIIAIILGSLGFWGKRCRDAYCLVGLILGLLASVVGGVFFLLFVFL